MPGAGSYSYIKQLLRGRPIPLHPALDDRPFLDEGKSRPIGSDPHSGGGARPAVVLLRLATALGTIAIVSAAALILWLAPWPVDILMAVAAAVAWSSWLDRQEPD